jgi:2,4-dienoyl-CoA reductase-like NADH-dependent reductase (Old Yellow Enzyme family)
VLDERSQLPRFAAWAEAGRSDGAHLFMQLNHPGKQVPSFLSMQPVAPSDIPLGNGLEKAFNRPRALAEAEIWAIVEKFAAAAQLAQRAGFTGVQIHGAHGYLVSQFLSPWHNQRSDGWGGSPEKRRRFMLEVYRAIRAAVGRHYPVAIKLNSADFQRGGFTEDESMAAVDALAEAGIDLIEISGGNYESPAMTGFGQKASTQQREAYFLEYAEKVRARVRVPLVVTGGFRSGTAMLEALRTGATDLIGMARPLAVVPDFPNRLLRDPNAALQLKRPSTGLKLIDRLSMLDITWYESQLDRIGRGKPARADLCAWGAVAQVLRRSGAYAFRARRA